jgi:hypothetical protein
VVQTAQMIPNYVDTLEDPSAAAWPARGADIAEALLGKTASGPDRPSATARLVSLEQGLFAVVISELAGHSGQLSGLLLPVVQVSAPPGDGNGYAEIIGASGRADMWLGPEGGTVIVKAPPGGACILLTAYGLSAQPMSVPEIEIQRLDRARMGAMTGGLANSDDAPDEIQTEVVLHIERLGDRRFPAEGWVGNRGKKLRIEAFSIRPLDGLVARDIEFKALGPNRRQTPWVTDAKLCGTRGQGLPLTGFAIRLASHVVQPFDVVYEGSFFESGVVGPCRNGELCVAPIANDPLEAISVRVLRRR